ncbi:MAG: hypothetical protein J6P45_03050 [Lachnospiraceae bacterium]|nr:hypothetical protein [Lachnospiraceae bacterium]
MCRYRFIQKWQDRIIGKYISKNSRHGFWGKGAIDAISSKLDKDLPGLRGFSPRNLRNMRTFYEEWNTVFEADVAQLSVEDNLADASAKLEADREIEIWQTYLPKRTDFKSENFFSIGFSQHILILSKIKVVEERLYYIDLCAQEKYTYDMLKKHILADDFHHRGLLSNNFKQAIQSKIGTTVDTSDMEKELSVVSAKLHQAEAIKTHIEQQMDSLDVNTAHYEKKIADLQRRLDSQYDTIDETEQAIAEVRAQILDLKKSSISADSIYEFLLHFDEIYRECTDAEKKKFMQSFVDRIEL